MKKITLVLISFFLISLFVEPALYNRVNAQEEITSESQTLSETPTPTVEGIQEQATPSVVVKYDLAYPGMLPDNPIYKLKILRDKLAIGLINDPKNKIEFYLLQADKGILASAILVDKKKVDLAVKTALRAENNFTLLTDELGRLHKKLDKDLYNKLKNSSLKHQEVLLSLSKRVSDKDKKVFITVVEFSKRNWDTIEKYQRGDIIR